jgi:DNA-binding transcriptional ArsR family regulator
MFENAPTVASPSVDATPTAGEPARAAGEAAPPVGRVFDALGDPTRRSVVELLGSGPRRAGELAAAAGTSPPTMSRHLRVLLDAGIVADERPRDDARTRVFRLRPESMTAVQAWLDQIHSHWDEQLSSFKRHVEGRARR